MTRETPATPSADDPGRTRGSVFMRALRDPAGLIAGVIIALAIVVAVFADVLAPYGANESDLTRLFEQGGNGHFLGTDGAGRDVVSLLIYGTRSSLIGALIAVAVSMEVGVTTGLVAGYYGRL